MIEQESKSAEELGHEPIVVSTRAVGLTVAVLLGTVLMTLVLVAGLSRVLSRVENGEPRVGLTGAPVAPPAGVPNVEANQSEVLRDLRTRERKLLSEYKWIDRNAGVARVPIDRAMNILAERPVLASDRQSESTANGDVATQ